MVFGGSLIIVYLYASINYKYLRVCNDYLFMRYIPGVIRNFVERYLRATYYFFDVGMLLTILLIKWELCIIS